MIFPFFLYYFNQLDAWDRRGHISTTLSWVEKNLFAKGIDVSGWTAEEIKVVLYRIVFQERSNEQPSQNWEQIQKELPLPNLN